QGTMSTWCPARVSGDVRESLAGVHDGLRCVYTSVPVVIHVSGLRPNFRMFDRAKENGMVAGMRVGRSRVRQHRGRGVAGADVPARLCSWIVADGDLHAGGVRVRA